MSERKKNDYKNYYDILESIGNGAYGNVYKGRKKGTNDIVGIKVIEIRKLKENLLYQYGVEEIENQSKLCIEGFIKEFEIMEICSKNNNNSVKCYEYFVSEEKFVIIMELCDINLSKFLIDKNEKEKRYFNSKEILEILLQLNKTFQIMKKNNIIHRDLKLENILIKFDDKHYQNFTIKLADYGSSKRLLSLSKGLCNSNIGTLSYMAPEILKRQEYNYKIDLWSLGVIIYLLYFGKPPYSAETEIALISKIERFKQKLFLKTNNNNLDNLIYNLLEKEPSKRLSWDKYFNHIFFEDEYINKDISRNVAKEIMEKKEIPILKIKYKKIIKVIYEVEDKEEDVIRIFGRYFVENNYNNIELIVNGIKSELLEIYELKKGINEIQIIIKTKINSLEGMFSGCSSLKNIEELKYLDTSEIDNFSYMFNGCSLLSDIIPLENWNVSKGKKFKNMFSNCSSLISLEGLENWDVSSGNNFTEMFDGCSSLRDIDSLENWNVQNSFIFRGMFQNCQRLTNVKSLKNWNVSNVIDFSFMFQECSLLSDLKGLENWKISTKTNFNDIPSEVYEENEVSYIDFGTGEILKNQNGINFFYMFSKCISLSNLKGLKKWNISSVNNIRGLFNNCVALIDISGLKNWDVSRISCFADIFNSCASLKDIALVNFH